MAAVVATAVAANASATSLLELNYNNAKTFGNVHIAGGAIDLTDGALIVTTSSFGFVPSGYVSGGSLQRMPGELAVNGLGQPEYGDAAIRDAIIEGSNFANNGFWNGTNGIISNTTSDSAANAPNFDKAVGWIDNAYWGFTHFWGQPVNPSQSIITLAWDGDPYLSGKVTTDGYDAWVNMYTASSPPYIPGNSVFEWADGNYLNQPNPPTTDGYDNWVNAYTNDGNTLVSAGYIPPNFDPAPIVPSATAVPEPGTVLLVAISLISGIGLRFAKRLRR
jgi:hypothetical protein